MTIGNDFHKMRARSVEERLTGNGEVVSVERTPLSFLGRHPLQQQQPPDNGYEYYDYEEGEGEDGEDGHHSSAPSGTTHHK